MIKINKEKVNPNIEKNHKTFLKYARDNGCRLTEGKLLLGDICLTPSLDELVHSTSSDDEKVWGEDECEALFYSLLELQEGS